MQVREGKADDLASVTDALVSAFHDDPVMLYIFDKPGVSTRLELALFAIAHQLVEPQGQQQQ